MILINMILIILSHIVHHLLHLLILKNLILIKLKLMIDFLIVLKMIESYYNNNLHNVNLILS
jgi:hypothetical protein